MVGQRNVLKYRKEKGRKPKADQTLDVARTEPGRWSWPGVCGNLWLIYVHTDSGCMSYGRTESGPMIARNRVKTKLRTSARYLSFGSRSPAAAKKFWAYWWAKICDNLMNYWRIHHVSRVVCGKARFISCLPLLSRWSLDRSRQRRGTSLSVSRMLTFYVRMGFAGWTASLVFTSTFLCRCRRRCGADEFLFFGSFVAISFPNRIDVRDRFCKHFETLSKSWLLHLSLNISEVWTLPGPALRRWRRKTQKSTGILRTGLGAICGTLSTIMSKIPFCAGREQ
jgi:hypothetical protein